MENNQQLEIVNLYKFNDKIQDVKVIQNTLYICDESSLYKINKETNAKLTFNIEAKFFLNAIEVVYLDEMQQSDEVYFFISLEKQKLYYHKKEDVDIEISTSKNIGTILDIFLFLDKEYAFIFYQDGTIEIYNTSLEKIISKITLADKVIWVYKSYTTSELVVEYSSKIEIFDIFTLRINKVIAIEKDLILSTLYNRNVYLLYSNRIEIVRENGERTLLKLYKDLSIKKGFFNLKSGIITLIATDNTIIIFHILSNSFLNVSKYETDIVDISYIDTDFYITVENMIEQITTQEKLIDFQKAVTVNEFHDVIELIKTNPLLLNNPNSFALLQLSWRKLYDLILNKLFNDQIKQASELQGDYKIIASFEKEYQEGLTSKENFKKLNQLIRKIDYDGVFEVLNGDEIVKKSPIGKAVLLDWEKGLDHLISLILAGSFSGNVSTLSSLKKYENSSKRQHIIDTIIKNKNVVIEAISAFKGKRFTVFSTYIDRFPFLNELPIIQRSFQIGKILHQKIKNFIKQKEYQKALELAKELRNFPTYKTTIRQLEEFLTILIKFNVVKERRNTIHSRLFFEHYEEILKKSDDYHLLLEIEGKFINEALTLIDKKFFDGSYDILKEYFTSKLWEDKIRHVMAFYYVEHFNFIKRRDYSEENLNKCIENFASIFGFADNRFDFTIDYKSFLKEKIVPPTFYPRNLLDDLKQ
jgi:hypothetical protein